MPIVGISLEKLVQLTGRPLQREELIAHLGEMGCDVKGLQRVSYYRCPNCGDITELSTEEELFKECTGCGADVTPIEVGETQVIRIELLPDRPDLFDVGGLSRALKGYLGYQVGLSEYPVSPSGFSVRVDEELSSEKSYRPYIACAVVRGLKLDSELVRVLMKMQENLHWALGRDRRKASIGVYDLDRVKPDFDYRAVDPRGVTFIPLGGLPESPSKEATPQEILSMHPKGIAYKGLLDGFQRYPLLADSEGEVLSMPPIINSEHTRVSEETRHLFADVTGPDERSVERTLSVLVTSLAELGGTIESVEIAYKDRTLATPDLSPKSMMLDPSSASRVIGVDIPSEDMLTLLRKMRFGASLGEGALRLSVPAYRTDIMHEIDLIEDVAIAYGYHNIEPSLVPTLTVGEEAESERFSSLARTAMTGMGFSEVMSLMLTNANAHYSLLNLHEPSGQVRIENPASAEQSMVRTHLLSGLLETFRLSRTQKMPQRIFELGDVCFLDETAETGAKEVRKLAGGIMDPKTGFAEMKSVTESLTRELGFPVQLHPAHYPPFIEGRSAFVTRGGGEREPRTGRFGAETRRVGVVGEVHPQVLENFEIVQPVSIFELDLTEIACAP